MKKNIILLRGLIRESGHWGRFKPMLEKADQNIHVITPDIPGVGPYFEQLSPTSIHSMVHALRRQWIRQKQEGASYLVAVSLGGMIAAEWIKTFPKDFEKAILINTSFRNISPINQRFLLKNIPKLFGTKILKGIEQGEKAILETVSNNKKQREKALPEWIEIQNKRPVSKKNGFRQIFAAAKYQPGDQKLEIPIKILACPQDRLVSFKCSQGIHDKWGYPMDTHPTAGHGLEVDDPEWLLEKCLNWFEDDNEASSQS